MKSSVRQRNNQAKLWRETSFANVEMLRAAYRTHQFPPHAHDEYAFGLIEKGAQEFIYATGERLIMPQGTICVVNPGAVHEGGPATEAGWDYRMVYIPTASMASVLIDSEWRPQGKQLYFPQTVINDDDTMRLIYEAHICSESRDTSQLERASRLTQAVYQLASRHGQSLRPIERLIPIPGAVKRAREYIDAYVTENPSLESIARVAGMSPFHLIRAFRKAVGVAPHAYLVQRRVELAKHLLLKGRPLRQVAVEVGYYDQGHLSREFSRFFGVPPSVARQ
ncbi:MULTISPECIES: AraC family transcriptional regulator [Cupriavidus]|uniref:AraC-like DNA-binding protein n=2 Tax=Cupriavidus TaxID=106589 RepID=A0A7W4VEK3_9BURK|nr:MULTISPECIES: AraC family transcriptional regulator [Cupriavidus]MBB3009834.1 AraC-like DNA-binding protein [Cupriavidus alkaliphilus]QBY56286.1 AraC family transcriptional regulator [Cupriavidus oxalaticus]